MKTTNRNDIATTILVFLLVVPWLLAGVFTYFVIGSVFILFVSVGHTVRHIWRKK